VDQDSAEGVACLRLERLESVSEVSVRVQGTTG
jgi:hypothetical protein